MTSTVSKNRTKQRQQKKAGSSKASFLNPVLRRPVDFKMAAQVEEEPDLPEEVTESLETFHEALGKVEDVFKPLLETSVDDMKEKVCYQFEICRKLCNIDSSTCPVKLSLSMSP